MVVQLKTQPVLETERLILRPFNLDDAPDVQKMAGVFEVADTTLNIPHPYGEGEAERWIKTHRISFERSQSATYAITKRDDGTLVGAIGLTMDAKHERAEMGYWIGKPFWNNGYATEAARAMIKFGFHDLGLNRIFAHYLTRNKASGKVMEKAGMKYEGHLRQHVVNWGKFEDLIMFGVLKEDFESIKFV